jgi:hypothetical protein
MDAERFWDVIAHDTAPMQGEIKWLSIMIL